MPSTPQRREAASVKGETRARILQAASTLFAERGFAGASTHEIAAAAGVNQALVRYHFGTKEALWQEVIETGLAELARTLETAGPAPELEPRAAALFAALSRNPEPVRAIAHALLEPGARRDRLMRDHLVPLLSRALAWLHGSASRSRPADPSFMLMWIAAAAAPALFAPALAAVDRGLDAQVTQRTQRDALVPWLRGEPLRARGGPWSLAEARRRGASRARG
jgi:AcrR family transcriptional regulator